jgi:hypothetical protein
MKKCSECEHLYTPSRSWDSYKCELYHFWTFKWDGSMPKTSPVWCPLKIKKEENQKCAVQ